LGSEIPGYYTRYLTTIKDNIAILVTLSAHQKYYTKYSNDFFKAVETLKVIASNNRFNQRVLAPVKPKSERLGVGVSAIELNDNDVPLPHTNSIRNIDAATFGGVFLLLVAMIFYILKRRKNKNKKI
jgi:LPXTG-motif cell wall-anchored protein